jgi:hypothetical protein
MARAIGAENKWRPPVVDRYRPQIEAIKTLFPENFTDKSHNHAEHWAISIESIEEALRLLLILDLNDPRRLA